MPLEMVQKLLEISRAEELFQDLVPTTLKPSTELSQEVE